MGSKVSKKDDVPVVPKIPVAEAPSVIEAPLVERLLWENHRLKADNCDFQITTLQLVAVAEREEAGRILAKMKADVGDQYLSRMNKDTGILEFVRKLDLAPKENAE